MRFATPIILIILALVLFFSYTQDTYNMIQELRAEEAIFADALTRANELLSVRDELFDIRNNIPAADRDALLKLLPDHVDNVRLIIDIDSVAARRGLTLSNVSIGDVTAEDEVSVDEEEGSVGQITLSFGIETDYETFLLFINDLEKSLRILDIENLSFDSAGTGANADQLSYSISFRTYWLN